MLKGSIAEQRSNDVVSAFFDGIKSLRQYSVTQEDVIRSIMSKGAPRFYVSYEKACRFVSLIERGKKLPLKNPNKTEMYMELHRRYKSFADEHGCIGYKALEKIILEPAPSYYMNLKSFREIIYRYYKQHRISRECQ